MNHTTTFKLGTAFQAEFDALRRRLRRKKRQQVRAPQFRIGRHS